MTTTTRIVRGLHHVAIAAHDVDAVARFYGDEIGRAHV